MTDIDEEYIRLLRTLLQSYNSETGKPAVYLIKKYIAQAGWCIELPVILKDDNQ